MDLPVFPFRRDAADAFEPSDLVCDCCQKARGFINAYAPIYSPVGVDLLCPWCIAEGLAAEKYQAQFFFGANFCDDEHQPIELSDDWHRAVFGQTPGFSTYKALSWWVHCGEPAEFVGRNEPDELVFECCFCQQRHVIWDAPWL